ncbi:MAG: SDR family NAD(P)-dependent oxidoreductase [Acidimicrobiales bacterium]|jgi:decaprenylphospho-beta-D-erythro-pentofuranosid-2-ulose 2-reductase
MAAMPKTVVVLGGSSDLACAVLRELARRRLTTVLLAGRHGDALDVVAKELGALGVDDVETATFDASDVDSHEAFADEAARRVGAIDLVIVAAGAPGADGVEERSAGGVAGEISANFSGPAAAMVAFARVLRRQGRGSMVVFSSSAALRVRRADFVYGAAMAGLDAFARGLGEILHPEGVDVIVVRPGFVPTKMRALRRAMPFATSADDVATAVVRALGTRQSVVWVPRALPVLLVLERFVPRRARRRLLR